jgi:hypothetical protein
VADFVGLAATAKRLIDANGRTITVVKFGSVPQDSDKPWRGRREYHEAEVQGKAVFVPRTLNLASRTEDQDGVDRQMDYFYFAANNDGGFELETFDAIVDGARTWKIASVELIAPADTRVLYQIEVQR